MTRKRDGAKHEGEGGWRRPSSRLDAAAARRRHREALEGRTACPRSQERRGAERVGSLSSPLTALGAFVLLVLVGAWSEIFRLLEGDLYFFNRRRSSFNKGTSIIFSGNGGPKARAKGTPAFRLCACLQPSEP